MDDHYGSDDYLAEMMLGGGEYHAPRRHHASQTHSDSSATLIEYIVLFVIALVVLGAAWRYGAGDALAAAFDRLQDVPR